MAEGIDKEEKLKKPQGRVPGPRVNVSDPTKVVVLPGGELTTNKDKEIFEKKAAAEETKKR